VKRCFVRKDEKIYSFTERTVAYRHAPQRGILYPESRQTGYHVTMIELRRRQATSARAQ